MVIVVVKLITMVVGVMILWLFMDYFMDGSVWNVVMTLYVMRGNIMLKCWVVHPLW